jgi:hypothetical protein
MTNEEREQAVGQLKEFARCWNALYAAQEFEKMQCLATEDVGIANAQAATKPTGLIYGRQAYYEGICEA